MDKIETERIDDDNTEDIVTSNNKKPLYDDAVKSKAVLLKTIISLGLYIAVYYIFFHQNIQWILLLVAIMLFHEAGHFVAMKSFKYKDVQMFFVPFLGAFVSGRPDKISQKQRIITLLAGPLPGITAGIIFFFVFHYTDQPFYYRLSLMLMLLNVFNLLPVAPLDGGQLLENLFIRSGRVLQPFFLAASAVFLFYLAVITRNYFILLIVWFIITRFRSVIMMNAIRADLDRDNISYDKSYEELSDKEYMEIRERLIKHVPALKQYDVTVVAEDEEDIVSYMNKLLTGSIQLDMSRNGKAVVITLWIIFTLVPVLLYFLYAPHYGMM